MYNGQDKLVEVRRSNGITEYIEVNELKFEQFEIYHPIETCELVEEFAFETEICEHEIFIYGLTIENIVVIYSLLSKSYCKLQEEIKNLTLLDAT